MHLFRYNAKKFISIGLLLFAGITSAQPASICDTLKAHPDWIGAIHHSTAKWGVPAAVQLSIIYHESRFRATARNAGSSAYGYPQALNATWRRYQQSSAADARRDDFSDAVDFIGWYAEQMHQELGIAKDDVRKLYVAYHDGSVGYKKSIVNPKALASRLAHHVADTAEEYQQELLSCPI